MTHRAQGGTVTDFACLYKPFAFISPAHQQFGRQLCAAMPSQGVTLWRRAYVLLVMEYPGLAQLASLLPSGNKRTVVDACHHDTFHHPPTDEEAYMKRARFSRLLSLLGIAIVLGYSRVASA
jgi:hypothetical protein